jgi:DnaB helicase-like protein
MSPPARQSVEWELLRLLCDGNLAPGLRAEYCAQLTSDHFVDVTHRIIFEEIRSVSSPQHPATAELLREHLPGRVTARGFPDLEFESLFGSDCSGRDEAATLIQKAYKNLTNLE